MNREPTRAELAHATRRLGPMEFIETVLVLEDGRRYGEAMTDWQRAGFEAINATKANGTPLHRAIFDERRRGESKTQDGAAALLADVVTGPPGHHSFAVAGDQDQAGLVMESINGFVQRHPILPEVVEVQRWTVRQRMTGSDIRIMSADAPTAFGIRPRKILFDELTLQPDDRLWLAMWSAIGKRADAQMIVMTMAGWDFGGLAWKVREMIRSNPAYYFSSREGTEPAPWLSAEAMEEQRATLHPADFARFWECRWVEPKGSWITAEMYAAAEVGKEAIAGDERRKAVGFVDVGLVRDATAIAVAHQEEDRVVADTIRTLQGSRNEPVELEVLEDLVLDLTARFKVARWIFEAPQAVASVQRLQKKLGSSRVTARYPTAETQAKLFGSLYMLFSNRRLVLFPHERLKQEALSLVIKTTGGRMRVVESSAIHQDHVIALGGAAEMLLSGQSASIDLDVGAFSGLSRHRSPARASGSEFAGPQSVQPTSTSKWGGNGVSNITAITASMRRQRPEFHSPGETHCRRLGSATAS